MGHASHAPWLSTDDTDAQELDEQPLPWENGRMFGCTAYPGGARWGRRR